ncbi:CDP-glycerol glycerophosphotransferase family protein, partial [Oenococcus oeni]
MVHKFFCNIIAAFKYFFVIIISNFVRHTYLDDAWVISEKIDEARDNGYSLFNYLETNYPKIHIFYIIKKSSVDSKRIPRDRIIFYGSFKHYISVIRSRFLITSQSLPYPGSDRLYKIIIKFSIKKRPKKIWLQHGIIQNSVLHYTMDYGFSKYDMICVSCERERDFIIDKFNYPSRVVCLTGLSRFDNLIDTSNYLEQMKILIMPTYRRWLSNINYSEFTKSNYFQKYVALLNNMASDRFFVSHNIKVIFYPHYAMQKFIPLFKRAIIQSENITLASSTDYDVQDLLRQSSLLVTDYSSVHFDFAYMNKPLIYFQFDQNDFQKSHYKKGYFDFYHDGFGPV